jgi:hypothetical protein
MDWRAFGGFGGGAASNPAAQVDPPPVHTLPTSTEIPDSKVGQADSRPCIIYEEEDEEDRRERERLATTMKLMGIEQPSFTTPSPADVRRDGHCATTVTRLQRSDSHDSVNSGRSVTSPKWSRSSSPFNRLSSFLGKTGLIGSSPLSPEIERLDPLKSVTDDVAVAALEGFDKREKEQLAQLSKGSGRCSLTSPSADQVSGIVARRRASATLRSASQSTGTPSGEASGPTDQEHKHIDHANKASITTLWSLGEDEGAARNGNTEEVTVGA